MNLLHSANVIISATYRPLELYTAIAVIYLIIIMPVVGFSYYIEKKIRYKGKNIMKEVLKISGLKKILWKCESTYRYKFRIK